MQLCTKCKGAGADKLDNVCSRCNGLGEIPFESIENARTAYKEARETLHQARMAESAHTRFGICHDFGQGLVQKTIDANNALQAIMRDAIEQFGDRTTDCATCKHQSVFPGGPRHQASLACESGRNPHCSCDTCF